MTTRTAEDCDHIRRQCAGPCWTKQGFWTTKTLLSVCAAFIFAMGTVAGIAVVNGATFTTYRDAQDKLTETYRIGQATQTKMIVKKIDENHTDVKERIADIKTLIKAR